MQCRKVVLKKNVDIWNFIKPLLILIWVEGGGWKGEGGGVNFTLPVGFPLMTQKR